MRILLDESVPAGLGPLLAGHTFTTVPKRGWAGLKNGALLTKAEKSFDVLLTMDSNMVHQQNLARFQIAIIALTARSNRLADTRPLMPKVLAALPSIQPGTLTVVA